MADHIRKLAERYDVTVFCNFSHDPCNDLFVSSVKLIHIPFERAIHPIVDLLCLFKLWFALYKGQFRAIHSIMPKTGLLAMLAGIMAGVPLRRHMFTGQVWVTQHGFWRSLLKLMDRVIASLATEIYADSPSQRDFLINERIIRSCKVLGDGSVNGVDCERFKPNTTSRRQVRKSLGIKEEDCLFGVLSRLSRDKGAIDTIEAFARMADKSNVFLLLVGPDEGNVIPYTKKRFPHLQQRMHFVDQFTSEPEKYLPAMDVFCLQSYREGFGSSAILAAACGVPALASRIYGIVDAVAEGASGLLHTPGDIDEIRLGMERFAKDPALRKRFGTVARKRAHEKFPRKRLVMAMFNEYERLL
jgi:glycosyltransferase involved in cell wall biosynthesis